MIINDLYEYEFLNMESILRVFTITFRLCFLLLNVKR